MGRSRLFTRGFTLIELLIVVAIIAILAAIAVPNFLEAQTRSKVAACKSNMRSLTTALESYIVDTNSYPPEGIPNSANPAQHVLGVARADLSLIRLTTPIAYVTDIRTAANDPFMQNVPALNDSVGTIADHNVKTFFYVDYPNFARLRPPAKPELKWRGWGLSSLGPDHSDAGILWVPYIIMDNPGNPPNTWNYTVYDPTHGTVSRGDIAKLGGETPGNVYSNVRF